MNSLLKTNEEINEAWMAVCKKQMLWADFEVLYQMSIGKKIIIELGTSRGIGAIVLSSHGGKVYTIDNQENSKIIQDYLRVFWGINYLYGDTVETSVQFEDASVDLLYIDADHKYINVEKDYNVWFPKVKRGGYILFHDYSNVHLEVKKFIDEKILPLKTIKEIEASCLTVIKTFLKL